MEEDINVEKVRQSKEKVIEKYNRLKNSGKLTIKTLEDLLLHCNTIQEIIRTYLNMLKEVDSYKYKEKLITYFQILSDTICLEYNIKKLPEKERFYNFINKLTSIKKKDYLEPLEAILNEELNKSEEINSLLSREEKESLKYCRWNYIYNTQIDYKNEENEDYLFYSLTNNLLNQFIKNKGSFNERIELIKLIFDLFKEIEPRRKEKNICDYFEFLCIQLTNSELHANYNLKDKIIPILNIIEQEINIKFFNHDELISYLEKNFPYKIEKDRIEINYKNNKYIIDDYKKYNINEDMLRAVLNKGKYGYLMELNSYMTFKAHTDNANYYNGLLLEIIKKYAKSNLAITSIEKLFKMDKKKYPKLYKEICDNINNYLNIVGYNSNDTGRTYKNPPRILIDPYKEKFLLTKTISNVDLLSALKDFCNITYRKYAFGHEQHHLTTALSFFLYINETRRLNSLCKEITKSGEIKIIDIEDEEELNKIKKTNKFVDKEAGNLFEILCFGVVQKEFNLKQLLFIADERNDNLNYDDYKKKYEDALKDDLDNLLEKFPKNQILSELVMRIKDGIKLEKKLELNYGKNTEQILGSKTLVKKDEIQEESFIGNLDVPLIFDNAKYDNHLLDEKINY